MHVEFSLKSLLREFGVARSAAVDLAAHLEVTRQTASKIINGNKTISTQEIGQICDWFINRVVNNANASREDYRRLRQLLPGGLFRVAGAMERILNSNALWLYLGELIRSPKFNQQPLTRLEWISGADAEVATSLVHRLSSDGGKFEFHWENVSFHITPDSDDLPSEKGEDSILIADRRAAILRYDEMIKIGSKRKSEKTTVLLVGSQRVNYLVEVLFARLFSATPFEEADRQSVPVYLQYRPGAPKRPSCFGGNKQPVGWKGKGGPGIYYRPPKSAWTYIDCAKEDTTAGIVLLIDNPAHSQLIVTLFGFSGKGTREVGRLFQEKPESFWPIDTKIKDFQVALFVCELIANKETIESKIYRVL